MDNIIVGPCPISDTEADRSLGIDSCQYNKSWRKREQVHKSSQESKINLLDQTRTNIRRGPVDKSSRNVKITLPNSETRRGATINQINKSGRRDPTDCSNNNNILEARVCSTGGGWKCPDLQSQFVLFSKFANSGSDGTQITLRKGCRKLFASFGFKKKFFQGLSLLGESPKKFTFYGT